MIGWDFQSLAKKMAHKGQGNAGEFHQLGIIRGIIRGQVLHRYVYIPTYQPVPGGITESGALLLQVNIKQQPTKVNTN